METTHLFEFVRLIVAGKTAEVRRRLKGEPALATAALAVGASRQQAEDFFFAEIQHYLYAGDTALHMAAAAHSLPMAELLLAAGADVRARNRRGAEPIHYAADGRSEGPSAQGEVIACLASAGADPNVPDKSGVAPLHRAVRNRSLSAVRALLDAGADPRLPNKSGSTPLHLAVQTTGASGSGSPFAREQQTQIIQLLLQHGCQPSDPDAKGKTVTQAATSEWIRTLLKEVEIE